MIRRVKLATVFLIASWLSGCDQPSEVDGTVEERRSMFALQYDPIAYDMYSIRPTSGSHFVHPEVVAISAGVVDAFGYHVQDSVVAEYDSSSGRFVSDLYLISRNQPTISEVMVRLRFHLASGGEQDIDTLLSTLRYPYRTTEKVWMDTAVSMLGFDVQDSVMYVQPDNGALYNVNMRTGTTHTFPIGVGSRFVVVSDTVYYVPYDAAILARSITGGEYSVFTNGAGITGYGTTSGIDASTQNLWAGNHTFYPSGYLLVRYDLSTGTVIDSFRLSSSHYGLSVTDEKLFVVQSGSGGIVVLNSSTREQISVLARPAARINAIKVRDGYLYFLEYEKQIIARVPLRDLRPL